MKLLVPTPLRREFLLALEGLPVSHVYASLPHEPGRPLPAEEAERVAEQIAGARSLGVGFIASFDRGCTGNVEFTGEGQRWLVEVLAWLSEAGALGVLVANPYVAEMILKRSPELRVHISSLADVDSVDKALFFQGLGVSAIHLPEYVNRDLRLLKALGREVDLDLVLTVNLGCLMGCPLRGYHANFLSHASDRLAQACLDYALAKCTRMRAADPVELIKAPWIRPEDLARYEEVGFRHFKIAGEEAGQQWVLRAVTAYASRAYAGDLMDLLTGPGTLNLFGEPPVSVDNAALDGFLDFFFTKECRFGCAGCEHCGEWAQRALSGASDGAGERHLAGVERFLRRVTEGSFRAPLTRP